jgi:hypothetical protein
VKMYLTPFPYFMLILVVCSGKQKKRNNVSKH